MSARTFIFAGGGTGGHLYPGLAVWRELRDIEPQSSALFLCSSKPLDAEILTREGARFEPLPARPFGLRPGALWRFVSSWGPSVRAARLAMRSAGAGGPTVLAAMGGYVAAPAVQAARAGGVPTALINLDAVPGKANLWIARHARVRVSSADSARVPASWTRLAPIVRREAVCRRSPAECRAAYSLQPDRPTLLVTGGSQGAGSLNEFVLAFMKAHGARLSAGGWQVLHQTGPGIDDRARAVYQECRLTATVRPFLTDMGSAWGAATLAVARCGANTVAEAWANHCPALFLPYPYHRDQHQKFNAQPLERCSGAVLCVDFVEPHRNLESVSPRLLELVENPGKVLAMRAALESLGPADGARRAAQLLLTM